MRIFTNHCAAKILQWTVENLLTCETIKPLNKMQVEVMILMPSGEVIAICSYHISIY